MSRFGQTAAFPDHGTSQRHQHTDTQDKSCETSFADDVADKGRYSACAVLKKSGTGTGKRRVEFSDKCVFDDCQIPNGNGNGTGSGSGASESETTVVEGRSSSGGHDSASDYHCDTKFGSCVVKGAAQVEINAKSNTNTSTGVWHQNHAESLSPGTDDDCGYASGYGATNPVILNVRTLETRPSASEPSPNSAIAQFNSKTTASKICSTFRTLRKPTLAPDNCTSASASEPALTKEQATRQERQQQWEAELDLIIPVNEPESSLTSGDTSTLTSPPTEEHHQQQPLSFGCSEYGSSWNTSASAVNPLAQARSIPAPARKGIPTPQGTNKSYAHNSRIILVPDPSSFIPDSRTGSSVHLPPPLHPGQGGKGYPHHFLQFSPSSTTSTLSTISTDKSGSPTVPRRTGFCAGFELDVRQICVVCGFLIVAAALGVGVGVPIALQLQAHSKKESHGGWKHETVRKLLSEVPLIDGHNDLAWNLRKFLQNQLLEIKFDKDLRQYEPFAGSAWSHTDLKRLREGRVGAQLWSAYVPCSAQHLDAVQIAMEQIDVIKRLVDKYQNSMALVRSVKDIETAHSVKKIASLIAVEGGHAIGNSLAVLRILYDLGARSLTLTHNCNTPWSDSASSDHYFPDRGGLTEFGKLVVLECNRLGLIVDLAHVSAHSMSDALAVSRAPVIFSHSAASSLCNHSRNVPDDIMKLVTANGGLVMVSFYNVFIACNETGTMDDVIAHIEHVRQVAGVDHVGIGAGYDGINFVPSGLEDVSKYPDLIEALYNRDGWTDLDLKKLIGLNFLRVFRTVETVRDEWSQAGVGPIEEWIPRSELAGHPTMCSSRGAS